MRNHTIQLFNHSTFQQVKEAAFTLAETLIVIGIIGVVAALTLPNLNHATGDKETVTRVKKIYSSLTDAFDRAQVVYGDFDTWFNEFEDTYENEDALEKFAKRVSEFMKVSKYCGFDEGCMSTGPSYAKDGVWDNNYYEALKENAYMLLLSDGTSMAFYLQGMDKYGDIYGRIRVDVNGPNKGKNQFGKDIFSFDVEGDSIRPGNDSTRDVELWECFNMNYCTAWVVENGNLDYLKVDNEGNCPDGTQLSWTVTSCN